LAARLKRSVPWQKAAVMKVSGNILLFVLILSALCAPRSEATVYHSNGSVANIQFIHDTQAVDGDTITLPSGTFDWTARLNITKSITIQGNTTISGAGTSSCSANDLTIVKDDVPRSTSIILALLNPSSSSLFRLTGITFAPGATTRSGTTDGAFQIHGSSTAIPLFNARIDNCHFALLYQGKIIFPGRWTFGVVDHCYFEVRAPTFPFYVRLGSYGGNTGDLNGNGSWADYPWYGTNKFFFIETNSFTSLSTGQPRALVDADHGARFVVRHNYIHNLVPQNHGTEGGVMRGSRCEEIYDNHINCSLPWSGGASRSGGALVHDNIISGLPNETNTIFALRNYRETPARSYSTWGIADGTSVWDVNATEADGSHVDGHPPYLFNSGTVTRASVISGTTGTITDSTKHWTVNQWAGATGIYSIKSTTPGATAYTLGSFILSNTATTITYYYYIGTDTPNHLIFNVGDQYQIHKVNIMMDQCGRGKGDLITDASTNVHGNITLPLSNIPVNSVTGFPITGGDVMIGKNRVHYTGVYAGVRPKLLTGCTGGSGAVTGGTAVNMAYVTTTKAQTWPHQALEPCFSWNNVYNASPSPSPLPGATPRGTQYGMNSGGDHPTTILGIDFFNLGAQGWDTTPSQVSSKYTAALNGVNYVGTYIYPHPLSR